MNFSLIISVYNNPKNVSKMLDNFDINCPNIDVHIVDNKSMEETKNILLNWNKKDHSFKCTLDLLDKNHGKATAINFAINKYELYEKAVVVCMDGDILFTKEDINKLIKFVGGVKNCGMISLDYEGSPKIAYGDMENYSVEGESFVLERYRDIYNVAGGIYCVQGEYIRNNDCKIYTYDEKKAYWSEDAWIYKNMVKKGRVCGYLKNTKAIHLGDDEEKYSLWKLHVLTRNNGSNKGFYD